MTVLKYKGQRLDNGEWIIGYPVVCEGMLNKNKVYITDNISNFSCEYHDDKVRLGWFYEVDPNTLRILNWENLFA